MDALTAAGAFGTIIQLVCNYRAEKGADAALSHEQFMEWLDYHRHEEIKNLICNTAALRAEIDNVLKTDHALMKEKLDAINTTLATLTSHVAEFRALTVMMMPGAELSDQAVSILRQLVRSDASYFLKLDYSGGFVLQLENNQPIEYSEPKFVHDDLNKLCGLGLLALEYGSSGTEIYKVTRSSVRMIEAIDGKQASV